MHKLLSINTVAIPLSPSLPLSLAPAARHQLIRSIYFKPHGATFLRFTYKFETLYIVYVLCHSYMYVCTCVCECMCARVCACVCLVASF